MKTQTSSRNIFRVRARKGERHGAVLVAALVCLLVVTAILGNMLRGTLRAHRQLHIERDLRQTELLLQAGRDRAIFRLANDANYPGETWRLPAEAIANNATGQVTIAISPVNKPTVRQVKVLAEYPLGGETSIRRSLTFQIPPNTLSAQE